MSIDTSVKWVMPGLMALLLTALSANALSAGSDGKKAAKDATQKSRPQPEPREAPPPYVGGSAIMAEPLEGDSVTDFETAMKQVEEQATAAEYRKLKNAIGYHLTYDLEVGRSKEKLYKKLNGQTPNQIVTAMQSR